MTEANGIPHLPGWVAFYTTRETTRESLRGDARFDLLSAVVVCVLFALGAHFRRWGFTWLMPLLPTICVVVGLWKFAAVSWLDRKHAWECVPVQPQRPVSDGVLGTVMLILGLLLLALGGWLFRDCLQQPAYSLYGSGSTFPQESLQLMEEHNARVKAIKDRGAMAQEYEGELSRFNAAHEDLRRRREEELRAAAPRLPWVELGIASVAMLGGLFFCWGGYKQFRLMKKDRAIEPHAATDGPGKTVFRAIATGPREPAAELGCSVVGDGSGSK